ncbi:unnamed protein product, partial [Didymodactylos carnosus]
MAAIVLLKTFNRYQRYLRIAGHPDLPQMKNIQVEYKDDIAVVKFNQENSKVNTLSKDLMNEFSPLFQHLQNDSKVKGIVLMSSKPGSFIAGADI